MAISGDLKFEIRYDHGDLLTESEAENLDWWNPFEPVDENYHDFHGRACISGDHAIGLPNIRVTNAGWYGSENLELATYGMNLYLSEVKENHPDLFQKLLKHAIPLYRSKPVDPGDHAIASWIETPIPETIGFDIEDVVLL